MQNQLRAYSLLMIFITFFVQNIFASDLTYVKGYKFPNSLAEGITPAPSRALSPSNLNQLKGFTELLPFVTPSPDQEDANSCMIMSLTGIVELWLHRLYQVPRFVQDSDFDLSERWWMNLSVYSDNLSKVDYWFTDAIYLFNSSPAALNRNYRFTKGWYKETEHDIKKAAPNAPKAQFGTRYNWIDEVDDVRGPFVKLPRFSRKVLLRNEKENPWAIGAAPENIAEKIIDAMQKYKAPVQVIYNHEGYWHSVFIVGYDENMSSYNCTFINDSLTYFQTEADKSEAVGDTHHAQKFLRYKRELTNALSNIGGCHPKGMFYVRDSQYPDASEEIYVYDPLNPSVNKPYSKRIVLREFDWVRTMANHVNVIYPK